MAEERKPGEERLVKTFGDLCAEAKTRIQETTPGEVQTRLEDAGRDWLLSARPSKPSVAAVGGRSSRSSRMLATAPRT